MSLIHLVAFGDAISLFLYVLCIECLSHLINLAVRLWNPIQLSCDGPTLSHLMFTNDPILFVMADPD